MERDMDDNLIRRTPGIVTLLSTGLGKSWITCAPGHKACRDNRSVQYQRIPRLFEALALARGDGRYGRLLKPSVEFNSLSSRLNDGSDRG